MKLSLFISCVDGAELQLRTPEIGRMAEFLTRHDHEGSSVDATVQLEGSDEVYRFLAWMNQPESPVKVVATPPEPVHHGSIERPIRTKGDTDGRPKWDLQRVSGTT